MTDRLGRVMGSHGYLPLNRQAELVRVKYRIGESLRVQYRLGLDDGDQLVSARVFRGGASRTAYDEGQPIRRTGGAVARRASRPRSRRRLVGVPERSTATRRRRVVRRTEPPGSSTVGDEARSSSTRQSARSPCAPWTDHGCVGYVKRYAPGTVDVAALAARYQSAGRAGARAGRCSAGVLICWRSSRWPAGPGLSSPAHGEQADGVAASAQAWPGSTGLLHLRGRRTSDGSNRAGSCHAAELVAAACPSVAVRGVALRRACSPAGASPAEAPGVAPWGLPSRQRPGPERQVWR